MIGSTFQHVGGSIGAPSQVGRSLLAGLVLAVLVGASLLQSPASAAQAGQLGGLELSQPAAVAAQGRRLGGLDLMSFCRLWIAGSEAIVTGTGDSDSWRCKRDIAYGDRRDGRRWTESMFSTIPMTAACRVQYKLPNAYADPVDRTIATAWQCFVP